MQKYENYDLEDKTDKSPQNYEELDVRSRFRLISTSPSLDDRIKNSSCIQIQHVASEMYFSYQTTNATLTAESLTPKMATKKGEIPQTPDKLSSTLHATMREE
jgi:hypothetical protein